MNHPKVYTFLILFFPIHCKHSKKNDNNSTSTNTIDQNSLNFIACIHYAIAERSEQNNKINNNNNNSSNSSILATLPATKVVNVASNDFSISLEPLPQSPLHSHSHLHHIHQQEQQKKKSESVLSNHVVSKTDTNLQ